MRKLFQIVGAITCGGLLAVGGALADRALVRPIPAPAKAGTTVLWPCPPGPSEDGGADAFRLRP